MIDKFYNIKILFYKFFLIAILVAGFNMISQHSNEVLADGLFSDTAHNSLEYYEDTRPGDIQGSNLLSIIISIFSNIIEYIYICALKKTIFDYSQTEYNCLPDQIGKNIGQPSCPKSKGGFFGSVGEGVARLIIMIIGIIFPFFVIFALVLIAFLTKCTTSYVWAPHELINVKLYGKDNEEMCEESNGNITLKKNLVGPNEVPFLYTCNSSSSTCNSNTNREYGDMSGTYYCNSANRKYATNNLAADGVGDKLSPGMIVYAERSFVDSFKNKKCPSKPKDDINIATREQVKNGSYSDNDIIFYSNTNGRVKLCAAAKKAIGIPLLFPILYGCTPVAPPVEVKTDSEQKIYDMISDTRCSYFMSQRIDLIHLSSDLHQGVITEDVRTFLEGDMHLTSTIVGCMQDLLIKIIISPNSSDNSYMYFVQNQMKKLVFVVLTFYIIILGIKIMSSPQVPQRGEWMMFIMKFVIVVVFSTGQIWYDNNKITGRTGLFSLALNVIETISDIFIQSSNVNDPVRACYSNYNGSNILSSRRISVSCGGTTTPSNTSKSSFVELTPWDYLDCKLGNYLSFGTCRYNFGEIPSLWFFTSALISGVTGFLLAICMLVYVILIMSVVFRFVHVVILSSFMLAILCLMAPIFACFILFDYTKEIFQNWIKALIGYSIYPGMTFSFVALFIATLDVFFYGFTIDDLSKNSNPCTETQSVYCATYRASLDAQTCYRNGSCLSLADASCSILTSGMVNAFTERLNLIIFSLNIGQSSYISEMWTPMWNIMFFAIIFYFFSGSVISFFEYMSGVYGLGSIAKGDFSGMAISAAKKINVASMGRGVSKLNQMRKRNK
ncbi:TrbL/VirB6 family protein [Lyticum sinuosum]|uniref:Type IV secretion system protein VirB6 n=1 Tax=Lyticum sinuosum TaxID=1332059 RepID=A0AAE5AHM7_9RICK|nr:type IV secretion system protein [Lyticum sinuosum]MDZ5760864.1 Type IV secretion system protein VirB6 [Lyticum sinuosum]